MHSVYFKNSKNRGSQKEDIAKLIVSNFKGLTLKEVYGYFALEKGRGN